MTQGYVCKGYTPSDSDYEKIRQFTRKDFPKDSLYVFEVTLCNNDVDRDFEKFSVNALNQLAKLFVGKTGIKDHSMKSDDQQARIFETRVEKIAGRKTADGEDYYALKAKAYMVRTDSTQDFITAVDAGIKKEVSISCSVKTRTCSICSADRNTQYCKHIAGREYSSKTCFTVLDDVSDAYEFSFVAVPAQREAGVEKSFKNKKGGMNMNDIKKCLEGENEVMLSREEANELSKCFSQMEEEAQLGREYRKTLVKELMKLCSKAFPQMDLAAFKSVADIMTSKELIAFKNAFEKRSAEENKPSLQLAKAKSTDKKADYSQFRI